MSIEQLEVEALLDTASKMVFEQYIKPLTQVMDSVIISIVSHNLIDPTLLARLIARHKMALSSRDRDNPAEYLLTYYQKFAMLIADEEQITALRNDLYKALSNLYELQEDDDVDGS